MLQGLCIYVCMCLVEAGAIPSLMKINDADEKERLEGGGRTWWAPVFVSFLSASCEECCSVLSVRHAWFALRCMIPTSDIHTHTHTTATLSWAEHQTHDTCSPSVFRGCCCYQTSSLSSVFSAQYMNSLSVCVSLSLCYLAALLSNMCSVLSLTLTAVHPKHRQSLLN